MRHRPASALALLVVLLPVALAISAYAINVVYMELARTQLQVNTDVATRASGRVLAVTGDRGRAIEAAQRMLSLNNFVNQRLSVTENNIVFGASTRTAATERYSFSPSNNPNAVQFRTNGKMSVPMLFPTMGVPVTFRPIKQAISTQSELDIMLVLDRSGSMAFGSTEGQATMFLMGPPLGWKFGDPVPPYSRWNDAVLAVDNFLSYLSSTVHDEHVGLVTYADKSNFEQSLTTSYPNIQNALLSHSRQFNGGSTNIGGGINFGANGLADKSSARPWATRVLIVMTDGIWTSGNDPMLAAQAAAAQDIVIYTVTFSDEADQGKMAAIAKVGRGLHFHATTGAELADAFQKIAHSLPTLLTH